MKLTQERLKELLDYIPETGLFYWRPQKVSRGVHKRKVGTVAGSLSEGYVRITIDCRRYLAHRLAWLYSHGEWPSLLDHKDGDRRNNKLSNLRIATPSQNGFNQALRSDNRAGLKGARYKPTVTYRDGRTVARAKPFEAVIKVGNRQRGLGYFRTAAEAHAAYCQAAKVLFGEFARSN